MKSILKKLLKVNQELAEKQYAMDITFWDRSEKWQESENGQLFEDKMNELESVAGEVECAAGALAEFIDSYC